MAAPELMIWNRSLHPRAGAGSVGCHISFGQFSTKRTKSEWGFRWRGWFWGM